MAAPRLWVLVLLAGSLPVLAQEEGQPAVSERPVCLLTGFEPFGGAQRNASWEAVKSLAGEEIGGYRIATACLPVVYDEVAEALKKALAAHKPVLVISFGVGARTVRVERLARNGYSGGKTLDNHNSPPPREKILPGAKDQLPTALPVAEIMKSLKEAHIGATVSDDAGGYLCNECFYRLMDWKLEGAAAGVRARGFVHVPALGLPDPEGGTFTLAKLQQAVRLIVAATAREAAGREAPADAPK